MTRAASAPPTTPTERDLVADRDRLVGIGMVAVFGACAVFAVARFATQLAVGRATPWWGNAGGAVAMALLAAWYRGDRPRRSTTAVHGTALIATVALVIPAAYGMSSSKWWLSLVGFSVLLMGRRAEAVVWSLVTLLLVPLVALLEPVIVVPNAIGEQAAERVMAGFFFLVLLFGMTWAFRRAAGERARELAETAASLERANLVKSRFLAHMSHEIRTPLHGVIAMTDLALREGVAGAVREQIQTAQQSARTLLALLTNVLDVTRAESDALVLEPRPFDLHAALTDVLTPLAAQARARALELVARADPGVCAQRVGDRVRLGQIVLNLVTNALKFTPEGRVTVQVGALGDDRLRLTVTDTGIGIAAEKIPRIFEPFTQVSAADQRVSGGVGLGLAIVRELVGRMEGRVDVRSEVGAGSTFTIEIKLPPGEPRTAGPCDLLAAASAPEGAAPSAAPRVLEVLVCEDNVVNQKVVLRMLSRLGHHATVAGDGLAAWEALEKGAFDLVLTDVEMPGLTGIELTQRIRAREAKACANHVVIIGTTAHVGEEDRHRLFEAGMDGYLGKPFTLRELSRAIEEAGKART